MAVRVDGHGLGASRYAPGNASNNQNGTWRRMYDSSRVLSVSEMSVK